VLGADDVHAGARLRGQAGRLRLALLVLLSTLVAIAPLPSRADGGAGPDAGQEAPKEPQHPFQKPLPAPESAPRSTATRHARLSPAQCRRALRERKIPVTPLKRAVKGIATPVRLGKPLHGIRFVTPGPKSKYGILDCRLVLALDEFAKILARHGVVAARIDNFYRPRSRLPGRAKPSQHSYGLAADVVGFVLADGRSLDLERDWHDGPNTSACGPQSRPVEPTEETILLRNLACEVAREGIFHRILTPSYNAAHRDHLHCDIDRKARTLGVR